MKSTFNGTTTTYFVGTHYEVTGSTITKYYGVYGADGATGAQRIAMRTNGALNYLLGDHLGSTSLTTDANGQVVAELRYRAWGETRYASGTTPTDYQYTGQYSYAGDFGLLFYNARWYDPALGRFAQADTIVPQNQGVQAWDRYAYGNNNPSKYTDPTGHTVDCGVGDDCEELHQQVLRTKYDWFLKGRWDLQELDTIYGTGRAIETYANEVTGGNGLDWMHYALGNTTIEHGYHVDGHSDAMPFFGKGFGARIRLDRNWITHHWGADIVFAHELGHVWDINSGFGASGKTNRDLGGSSWCFFCAPGDGVPPWARDYHLFNGDAYGNSGRNEYFAEAFSASIYNPTYTPTGVSQSINSQIQIDLVNYLFPGGIQ